MSLKILQPNLLPAGQFDLHDDYKNIIRGGECALLERSQVDGSDGYAFDSNAIGPKVSVILGKSGHYEARDSSNNGASRMVFLADEGIEEYGTMLGSVIGGTSGQGTGMGSLSSHGAVTVGPRTSFASGKCTLFSAHGIYGISLDVINHSGVVTNDLLNATGGHSSPTLTTGDGIWNKVLEPNSGEDVNYAAVAIGLMNEVSLVQTTLLHASGEESSNYYVIYFYDSNTITKHS